MHHLDLTEDYSTDAILQTLRRFVSIRGCPAEIYSDQGSQLVAASKEIADLVAEWDWSIVYNWSATQGIKWGISTLLHFSLLFVCCFCFLPLYFTSALISTNQGTWSRRSLPCVWLTQLAVVQRSRCNPTDQTVR